MDVRAFMLSITSIYVAASQIFGGVARWFDWFAKTTTACSLLDSG